MEQNPPMTRLIGPQRPVFVLFGSSIVQLSFDQQGWASILAHKYARKADIILRGYGGWNSKQALGIIDKVFPKEETTHAALVIVYFGGNDSMADVRSDPQHHWVSPHVPLEEYKSNMRKIAEHIEEVSPTTRIVFLSTPPVNEYQIAEYSGPLFVEVRNNTLGRLYANALMEVGQEIGINVIDLFDVIQSKPGWWKTCFVEDGIHLSSEGNKLVADAILKLLKEVDWKPSLYYESMPTEFENHAFIGASDSTYAGPKQMLLRSAL